MTQRGIPHEAEWLHVYAVADLAGADFTMSLFIGSLSFDNPALKNQMRMGVLSGSAIPAILGYTALMLAPVADRQVTNAHKAQSATKTVG